MTADTGGDLIQPASAAGPEELCDLIADAISDGDLDAALSYYEPAAIVAVGTAAPAVGRAAIRQMLGCAVEAKLAYEVHVQRSLITHDFAQEIALLTGRWSTRGTSPEGDQLARAGTVSSIARRGPHGAWRVAAEILIPDIDDVSPRTPRDAHSTAASSPGIRPQ